MKRLETDIVPILDQFAKEEIGNRLSQFSIMALKNLILQKIDEFQKEIDKSKGVEVSKKKKKQ